jgi:phosphatidylglycerol:prolipoprotein diacylglycerol transferase
MSFGKRSVEIGGFEIYYYGMIIAFAICVAFFVGLWLFRVVGYREEVGYQNLLLSVPCGIIFARIYYVLFSDWAYYNSFFDVINIRGGGMAIYGAIIGGAIGIYAVARLNHVGFFTLADVVIIGVILAQSIGRWGNFVNDEAYGFEVGVHVPPFTVDIDGTPHLATFFYESVLNLIGFLVLFFYYTTRIKRKKYLYGTISAMYLIWYGVSRAIIEPLRADSLLIFGRSEFIFNRVSFMLSLALIGLGVLILYAAKRGWISQNNDSIKIGAEKPKPHEKKKGQK